MAAGGSRGLLRLWLLAAAAGLAAGRAPSCHEVRTAFQLQQIGPLKLVPDVPTAESDLQICQDRAPTCCTKKMEESYQAAVRRERMQSIQALNFELKYMIAGHTTAFQDTERLFSSFSSLLFSRLNNLTRSCCLPIRRQIKAAE